jgi:hypothetical protein
MMDARQIIKKAISTNCTSGGDERAAVLLNRIVAGAGADTVPRRIHFLLFWGSLVRVRL